MSSAILFFLALPMVSGWQFVPGLPLGEVDVLCPRMGVCRGGLRLESKRSGISALTDAAVGIKGPSLCGPKCEGSNSSLELQRSAAV